MNVHILYIEDNAYDASLVERYMRSTPHRLTVAPTIHDAQAAFTEPPDLMLVDMMLNATSAGFDFVKQVRADGYAKPIIAVTGLTTPKDIKLCYDVGCDGVIKKPYMITQLLDVLAKYER